jgi:very-long-chain enoyl-CoA reductase
MYTAPPAAQTQVALALSLLAQAANFRCHVILAGLRPAGASAGYVIPRGFLFDYITCPNYTAEVLGWAGFTVATQALPAGIFAAVGAAQMAQWALAKHARLRRTFDGRDGRGTYPRRWVMLPPVF